MAKLKILMTGGTGFLGKSVVPLLREVADVDVISRSAEGALRGDLTRWDGGLNLEALKKNRYDIFIHLAGLYDLSARREDCYQQNVVATGTALKIARSLQIPVFINASSVAAAINSALKLVRPYDLNFSRAFPDPYAESKALGEQLVSNQSSHFRLCINLRLGVLVGDSQTGHIERLDGPYHAPKALEKVRRLIENFPGLLPLPGRKEGRMPLVPVNKAAAAILGFVRWSQATSNQGYQSFHVTPKEGLAIHDLYVKTLKHLAIPHRGVTFIRGVPRALLLKASKWTVKFPEEQLSYLLMFPKYDTTHTREVLGEDWCPEFESYEESFWRGYDEYISHR